VHYVPEVPGCTVRLLSRPSQHFAVSSHPLPTPRAKVLQA